MKLHIKNMVCSRCIMVVKSELEKLGLHPMAVELGEVTLLENNIDEQKAALIESFRQLGFELIDDKKRKTVEKIKNLIVDLVHQKNNQITINLSEFLSQHLLQDYSSLSSLFSEIENSTIEQYFILQKIEKVKELLRYDELSLSEIAFELNYSSVAHLSNQFKKVTGISPSNFKNLKEEKRNQIEDL